MKPFPNLKKLLFIDIETVSAVPTYEELDTKMQSLWNRKAGHLNKEQAPSEVFERAGIYAEFGKVIVIGIGMFYTNSNKELCFRTTALSGDNEKQLLEEFKTLLSKSTQADLRLVAHNGKEFDFPYLSRRMLINNISLPDVLDLSNKKPWEIQHLDTMAMWRFGDWKSYTSLDLLATIFGIESPKKEMDGSMVKDTYYKEKNLSKISKYCLNDVVTVAQLFLKLNGMETVKEECVFKI